MKKIFEFFIAALSSAQGKCPQSTSCHFFMQTDSGRFLRPLSLSKGRRTAKNSRHFPIRKNGKEAIFYGLSGVPASASIAYGNGYAAPPIPAVP
ncbi:MAG: hypothetical protein II413_00920 [Treponema sp.]|nr:hypothetical protein [Treponema sp.]